MAQLSTPLLGSFAEGWHLWATQIYLPVALLKHLDRFYLRMHSNDFVNSGAKAFQGEFVTEIVDCVTEHFNGAALFRAHSSRPGTELIRASDCRTRASAGVHTFVHDRLIG